MSYGRRFQFEGDDTSYIRYLEARVLELENTTHRSFPQRSHVRNLPVPRSHDSAVPESHGGSSPANISRGAVYNCTRQRVDEPGDSDQARQNGGTRLAIAGRGNYQDIQQHDDAQSCPFEVIEYNPSLGANFPSKKRRKGARSQGAKDQLQILSNFTCFIRDLPKSKTWKQWVSVDDSQRVGFTRGLVEGFAPMEEIVDQPVEPKLIPRKTSISAKLAILHEYGNSMNTSNTTGRQLKRFRELIFCSLCAVALRSAKSKDEVYEAMRGVFGSDAHSKTFDALIRGAKWINHTISLLSYTKWALRSWDMVLVGK